MKLVLLLLLPVASLAQIPVKSNAIQVSGVTFVEACNKLLDMGYTLEKKDGELQTAKTEQKEFINSWSAEHRILIRVKDTTLYITGTVTAPRGGGLINDEKIFYAKAKKSLTSVAFMYLNEFALSFGKPIQYLKQ